ncbi:hypothetical protein B0H12DRAFT_1106982 [Mycena haematopus]|nr:hypothetical protein B0H12DRAFT_1106982 [Mycena haematopus]
MKNSEAPPPHDFCDALVLSVDFSWLLSFLFAFRTIGALKDYLKTSTSFRMY